MTNHIWQKLMCNWLQMLSLFFDGYSDDLEQERTFGVTSPSTYLQTVLCIPVRGADCVKERVAEVIQPRLNLLQNGRLLLPHLVRAPQHVHLHKNDDRLRYVTMTCFEWVAESSLDEAESSWPKVIPVRRDESTSEGVCSRLPQTKVDQGRRQT